MINKLSAAVAISICMNANYAFAEDTFVAAQSSEHLENGVSISYALSTVEKIEPVDGVYRVTGALFSSELGSSELTVVVPEALVAEFDLESGYLVAENPMEYSHRSAPGPDGDSTYHFLRVPGADDEEYLISIVDDPHPCLPKVAVGAMFIAVCGGIHVYNTQSECSGGGVEFSLFGLSCSAKCAES